MSRREALLKGLAANPALPAELVRRLFAYPRVRAELARRPDLPGDLVTEILGSDDHWLLHSFALSRHLSDDVRLRLARHPDDGVRAATVVGDRPAPRELYELLVTDPVRTAREDLAKNELVPDDLRARLAEDPDPTVRATLARWWPTAPEEVRRRLLTDPEDQVRAYACATYYARLPHPVPPADLVPALLADPVTRTGAVRHAVLTPSLAARLAEDPDSDVRVQLASHPSLPAAVRDRLAADPSPLVRLRVFARQDTSESLRARLYTSITPPGPSLADLPVDGTSEEEFMRQAEYALVELKLGMMNVDWVIADPLPHVTSPYVCFRASAARSPHLPDEAVHRLLADETSQVRVAMLVTRPDLADAATAERIDRDYRPVKRTRFRPADAVSLPPSTLRRLATDPDPRMRLLAPRDPDLPAELAARLATDPDTAVRATIAGHPRLPVETLTAMLDDPEDRVAGSAAAAPALPIVHMERMLADAGL